MNLANKLTTLRVVLIPFFVYFQLSDISWGSYAALGIFIVASLTDMLDGYIARSRNLVTDFGKFMDPLADKLLVCSALICFVQQHILPAWMVIIIVTREFIISGFRLIAAQQGVVIAAGIWGKLKTVFQMLMIIMLILKVENYVFGMVTQVVIWICLALTIISLVDYIIRNRQVISKGGF